MKTLLLAIGLAVVVYVLTDQADVILDWIIELFDNPNF